MTSSLLSSSAHEKPGDSRGNHEPGYEIGTGNDEAGEFLAADADGHGAGGEIEPGDGMKDDEEKADDVYGDDDGIFQKALKIRVGLGAAGEGVDLEKHFDDEDGDEDAADFAQDEAEIFPALEPRSEEHTSELQSPDHLVCRLLLEKKKKLLLLSLLYMIRYWSHV